MKTYEQVKDSVQHIPMKVFLPPLHIKPGLIKCLVKAMAKTNLKGFQYLSKKSPNISTGEL
jgi:transposase